MNREISFISARREGVFTYFDYELGSPSWKGKKVLDFGGNIGNLLHDRSSTIEPRNYWCIDVSRDAIERGKLTYPAAHWLFYNRYNFVFNPSGIEGLEVPDAGQEFDYVVAYSVFTHTSKAEMMDLVAQLGKYLANDGAMAFTFVDPNFNPATLPDSGAGTYSGTYLQRCLEETRRVDPDFDVDALLKRASGARWLTLINDKDLYVDDSEIGHYEDSQKITYMTFYTPEYMGGLFPCATVRPPALMAYPNSVDAVFQHCCIISKAGLGEHILSRNLRGNSEPRYGEAPDQTAQTS